MLLKLGPLNPGRIADLRPYFDSVPDPRAAGPVVLPHSDPAGVRLRGRLGSEEHR
ncbi:hypothetical protein QFZ66_005681 [Streptomyces sp. B4I13]|uniref:hypothetical protein n=1 Tax=Streptomyces sp. B4I13 TaxID=3042271 RepID=UPI002780CF15|nr:hypothetical protein [Streptomyces sp. B4I13]MDQ0961803.1 hypothetical protein [Streptomyces sp. B4I13]